MKAKCNSKGIKLVVSFILVMTLMFGSMTSFAEMTSAYQKQYEILNEKLAAEVLERFSKGEEKVEVLIKLKEQADVESIADSIRLELDSFRHDDYDIKVSVRENVVGLLEKTSERTQNTLLKYIESELKLENVEEYESYYIVNMIYVKATKDVINNLALMDEVEKVYFNEKVYLIDYTVDSESIIEITEETIEEQGEGKIEQVFEVESFTTAAVSPSDIEWNIKQVNADKVWNTYGIDGTGVVVGMIDSGVTWDHPALKNKYRGYNSATGAVNHSASWYDAYAGRTTPYDDSASPHGTHVMGTILGQESTGRNAIGVAPGAKFIVAKGLGPNGGSANNLLSAAQWMLKPGGSVANAPDIVNNSWGGGTGINDWFRDAVRSWRAAGILPVFAAGNQTAGEPAPWPGSISLPSSYPESFAVAATDSSNRRGSFSKLGPSPYDSNLPKPDISAPGVSIRSSVPGGYESGWSGTSMASPNVAGVAALLLEANPNLSVAQIESTIKNTATALRDNTYTTSPNMGYGYGLVNALSAVESVRGTLPVEQTGTVTGRITNNSTGNGISGARVTIDGTTLSTITNSIGYYTLTNVPGGSRTLRVTASGYTEISGTITVTANQTVTINGTMVPSAPVEQTGTVTGRVTNINTGYALYNARVSINGTSLYAYSDRNGYFTLNNVPAGSQTITISLYGYKTVSGNITVNAGRSINVTVRLAPNSYY